MSKNTENNAKKWIWWRAWRTSLRTRLSPGVPKMQHLCPRDRRCELFRPVFDISPGRTLPPAYSKLLIESIPSMVV